MRKIYSFGLKHGQFHGDAVRIDCRDLKNPFRHPVLGPLTGKDSRVQDFVLGGAYSNAQLDAAYKALQAGLDIAFYCIGGRHRSVAMAEVAGGRMREAGYPVEIIHRELD